ncbi:polymorphic toxin type 15 domain-containing protein, partial [Actinomyces wuliandei]|uniref:polymorphic toxin type 15 domain-containing protein n=1 Tax=Actinomyces wuliandei TaxID=2057743 RepID=UPI001118A5CA
MAGRWRGRPRWLRRGRPPTPPPPLLVPQAAAVCPVVALPPATAVVVVRSLAAAVAGARVPPWWRLACSPRGRAGGQGVLVWEGSVAAPASPLGWHSRVPVEVFFHTGHHHSTQELAREFTRQLDRQLSALSLLSAQRLLEGIRAYRAQGRQPTSKATRNRRKKFMEEVVGDLVHVHHLSWEDAQAATREVDRALVVLHESDQVTYGPSQPATTTEGWPSLGHGVVSSSI